MAVADLSEMVRFGEMRLGFHPTKFKVMTRSSISVTNYKVTVYA